MNLKDCRFYNPNTGKCDLLYETKTKTSKAEMQSCTGWDDKCGFCKTTEQYDAGRDNAIIRCRAKGLCGACKYTKMSCKLSTEVKIY